MFPCSCVDLPDEPVNNAASPEEPKAVSTERKYLLWLGTLLLAGVLSLGAFNWLMDPHRFFDSPDIPGVNVYKTFTSHMRIRKPIHIYQRAPTTLIMGSSRAGEGLHCEYLPGPFAECYNAAIRGITPYEQWRMLEHAVVAAREAGKPIQRVVLNLGFATFTETGLSNEGFEEALFARLPEGTTFTLHKAVLDKLLYALFSREAFEASRNTLLFQDRVQGWFSIGVLSLEKDGSWRTHPLPRASTDAEWVHNKNAKMWGSAANAIENGYGELERQIQQPGRFEKNYQSFEHLLEVAYQEKLFVQIMLSPAHVEYMHALDRHGLWPYEEQWKRRVVEINERLARKYHMQAYRIWDFEAFNEYAKEPSWNALAVGQTMQWYKDVVHFSEALGAKMLDVLVREQLDGNWYSVVNGDNLEAHLQQLRAEKDAYFRAHPVSTGAP